MAIKLSGNDVTFGENTVAQSGQRLLTKTGVRERVLTGERTTGFHWNGHRFPPPPAGSVLYLPGYPAQGSVIQDFSGQGNDGTITGAVWKRLPSGLWYLDFDGIDDQVNCGSDSSIDNIFSGGGAVVCWVNPRSDGESNQGNIFNKLSGKLLAQVREEAASKVKVAFDIDFDGAGDGRWKTTATELTINTWAFLAISYNSDATANQPTFYIDAQILTVGDGLSVVSNPVGTVVSDATGNLILGGRGDGGLTFDGGVALSRYVNAELGTDVALSIYNQEQHLFGV